LSSLRANAQERLGILEIFDQFLLSHHAASKCIKPDSETLGRFLGNFQTVWMRSAEEIQKRHPEYTIEEIGKLMEARNDFQDQRVNEVIQSNGCKDARIQDLLRRFQVQANLQFGD
jgi:hypothetical protein